MGVDCRGAGLAVTLLLCATLACVDKARASAPAALYLAWPVPPRGVTSLFGARRDPLRGGERIHRGVDIEADYGAIVSACAAGKIVFAGWHRGHGRSVELEHAGGYRTRYSHLSQILVFAGREVVAGAALGRVGNSGRSTGPHLHFEVTRDGRYIDPLDVLDVALPLGD